MTNRSNFALVWSLVTVLLVAQVGAQVGAQTFEVISVKLNKSGKTGGRVGMSPGGRFQATNVPLKQLITNAYNLRPFQVVGGPAWLESDRFDVIATAGREIKPAPGGMPPELIQMLKAMLAERFALVAHIETRDTQIYHLVLARADGKLGEKISVAKIDCAALMMRGGPPPAPAPGQMPPCATRFSTGLISTRGGKMEQFVRTLAGAVERHVVDKTGLAGAYDLDVEFSPNQTADTAGPSIFTALQEQVGLKLEPARGPVEVLVIDRAEQPTPD